MADGVVCGITSDGGPRSCLAGVCTDAPGDMVLIPGGKAYQGCNAKLDADCAADEKPQRETDLPSFWIDRTEVSRGAYQAWVDVGTCPAIDKSSACNDNKSDDAPATCLSHAVASAYCTWRGARLQTEAEWEKAARGGCDVHGAGACATATPIYTWGEQGPLCTLTVKQSSKTGNAGCGSGGPFAPGSRAPDRSVYGVLDMGGNPLRARAESDRSTSRPAAPRAI